MIKLLSSVFIPILPIFVQAQQQQQLPPSPPSFFAKFPTNPHGLTISHSETLQIFGAVDTDKFIRKFGWPPREILRPLEYEGRGEDGGGSSKKRRSPIVLGFGRFVTPPLPEQLLESLPPSHAFRRQPTVYTDFSIAVPACAPTYPSGSGSAPQSVKLPLRCAKFGECAEIPDCVYTVLLRSWTNGTSFVPFARTRLGVDRRVSKGTDENLPGQVWELEEDASKMKKDRNKNGKDGDSPSKDGEVLWEEPDPPSAFASSRNLTFHVADENGSLLFAGKVKVKKRHSDVMQEQLRRAQPGQIGHQIMPFAGTLPGLTDPVPDNARIVDELHKGTPKGNTPDSASGSGKGTASKNDAKSIPSRQLIVDVPRHLQIFHTAGVSADEVEVLEDMEAGSMFEGVDMEMEKIVFYDGLQMQVLPSWNGRVGAVFGEVNEGKMPAGAQVGYQRQVSHQQQQGGGPGPISAGGMPQHGGMVDPLPQHHLAGVGDLGMDFNRDSGGGMGGIGGNPNLPGQDPLSQAYSQRYYGKGSKGDGKGGSGGGQGGGSGGYGGGKGKAPISADAHIAAARGREAEEKAAKRRAKLLLYSDPDEDDEDGDGISMDVSMDVSGDSNTGGGQGAPGQGAPGQDNNDNKPKEKKPKALVDFPFMELLNAQNQAGEESPFRSNEIETVTSDQERQRQILRGDFAGGSEGQPSGLDSGVRNTPPPEQYGYSGKGKGKGTASGTIGTSGSPPPSTSSGKGKGTINSSPSSGGITAGKSSTSPPPGINLDARIAPLGESVIAGQPRRGPPPPPPPAGTGLGAPLGDAYIGHVDHVEEESEAGGQGAGGHQGLEPVQTIEPFKYQNEYERPYTDLLHEDGGGGRTMMRLFS